MQSNSWKENYWTLCIVYCFCCIASLTQLFLIACTNMAPSLFCFPLFASPICMFCLPFERKKIFFILVEKDLKIALCFLKRRAGIKPLLFWNSSPMLFDLCLHSMERLSLGYTSWGASWINKTLFHHFQTAFGKRRNPQVKALFFFNRLGDYGPQCHHWFETMGLL